MLSRCFSDFSVGVGAFVIWLSQTSSFLCEEVNIILKTKYINACYDVIYYFIRLLLIDF